MSLTVLYTPKCHHFYFRLFKNCYMYVIKHFFQCMVNCISHLYNIGLSLFFASATINFQLNRNFHYHIHIHNYLQYCCFHHHFLVKNEDQRKLTIIKTNLNIISIFLSTYKRKIVNPGNCFCLEYDQWFVTCNKPIIDYKIPSDYQH